MYNVSTQFNTKALSQERNVYIKLLIGTTQVSSSDVMSMSVTQSVCDENITMGTANSQMIKFTMRKQSISLSGAVVKPYFSFDNTEWCPMGTFIVSESNNNGDTVEVTAYDKIATMSDEYTRTVPCTAQQILNDITTRYALNSITITNNPTIEELQGSTYRDQLGYIAGLQGKNAVINKDGQLEFIWFSASGQTVSGDAIYENELSENGTYTIQALISGTDDNRLVSGSGKAINFYNPYMTQDILDAIRLSALPFTFTSGAIKYRGNPAFELGDTFTADTHTYAIMSHNFEFDGGLYANVESYGLSSEKDAISRTNGVQKEVEKQVSGKFDFVERQIANVEHIAENIAGGYGGYYEVLMDEDDENRPYGTAWWADQSKTDGWMFTYGGLGFFHNGVIDPKGVCFDNEGNLNANYMTLGTLDCSKINVENLTLYGNVYRNSTSTGEQNYLLGYNINSNLQLGSPNAPTTDYDEVNIYGNGAIHLRPVHGALTNGLTVTSGGTTLNILSTSTVSTNKLLCVNASGVVCDTGKTIADIGSGGGAVFG